MILHAHSIALGGILNIFRTPAGKPMQLFWMTDFSAMRSRLRSAYNFNRRFLNFHLSQPLRLDRGRPPRLNFQLGKTASLIRQKSFTWPHPASASQ